MFGGYGVILLVHYVEQRKSIYHEQYLVVRPTEVHNNFNKFKLNSKVVYTFLFE